MVNNIKNQEIHVSFSSESLRNLNLQFSQNSYFSLYQM